MSVLGAMAELLASKPGAPFGALAVDIWAPTIPSEFKGIGFAFARYTGTVIDTFGPHSDEQPRVQLTIKSAPEDHDAAEALADQARTWMADQHDVTLDGYAIGYVRSLDTLLWLGPDAELRHVWTTNFEVTPGA